MKPGLKSMLTAAALSLICLLLHWLGGPQHTAVLAGAEPAGLAALLGLLYWLSWTCSWLVSPPLLLFGLVRLSCSPRPLLSAGSGQTHAT